MCVCEEEDFCFSSMSLFHNAHFTQIFGIPFFSFSLLNFLQGAHCGGGGGGERGNSGKRLWARGQYFC